MTDMNTPLYTDLPCSVVGPSIWDNLLDDLT